MARIQVDTTLGDPGYVRRSGIEEVARDFRVGDS